MKTNNQTRVLRKSILVFFSLFIVVFLSSLFAQTNFPGTPAGKRANEILKHLNSADTSKVEKYINENYTNAFRNAFPISQHVGIFSRIHSTRGRLELYEIEASTEYSIDFLLLSSSANSLLNVHLETENFDQFLISSLGFRPGGEPETTIDKKNDEYSEEEKKAIQKVIQDALVDGYLNNYDINEMEKGIHPVFRSMEIRNNSLSERGYEDLKAYVKRVKPQRPNGRRVKVTVKFLMVDVVGNIGCAKVEFYDGPTLHGTDFITLMKFQDGWKIMGAIAQEH